MRGSVARGFHFTPFFFLLLRLLQLTLPDPGAPGPNPLVQTDGHRVHRANLSIKRSLEVSMRTQTLLDETASSALGPERQALEPLDVCIVEEHVAHSSGLTMDLEGMSAQDNPLGNDTSGIGIFKGAHGYQFWSLKRYSI